MVTVLCRINFMAENTTMAIYSDLFPDHRISDIFAVEGQLLHLAEEKLIPGKMVFCSETRFMFYKVDN